MKVRDKTLVIYAAILASHARQPERADRWVSPLAGEP